MQRLTIKTARRLETQIDDEIVRMKNKISSLRNGRFHSAEQSVTSTTNDMNKFCEKIDKLVDIKFNIRKGISLFNASSDINNICIEIAKLSSDMEMGDLINRNFSTPEASQSYSSNATCYTSGLSEDTIEEMHVNHLKRKRIMQRLKDKCTGINASGHIELDEDDIKSMKEFGLMD